MTPNHLAMSIQLMLIRNNSSIVWQSTRAQHGFAAQWQERMHQDDLPKFRLWLRSPQGEITSRIYSPFLSGMGWMHYVCVARCIGKDVVVAALPTRFEPIKSFVA